MSELSIEEWDRIEQLFERKINPIINTVNETHTDVQIIKNDIKGNGSTGLKQEIENNKKDIERLKRKPIEESNFNKKLWIPIGFTIIVFLLSPLINKLWNLIFV